MKFKTCREQKEKANMESYPDSKQTLGSSFHCWVMVALVKGFVANLGDPTQGFSEDLQCSHPTSAPSEHGWLAEWAMFGMTKPPKIHLICAVKFQPAGLLKGFEGSDFCDLLWVQLDNMSGKEKRLELYSATFFCVTPQLRLLDFLGVNHREFVFRWCKLMTPWAGAWILRHESWLSFGTSIWSHQILP